MIINPCLPVTHNQWCMSVINWQSVTPVNHWQSVMHVCQSLTISDAFLSIKNDHWCISFITQHIRASFTEASLSLTDDAVGSHPYPQWRHDGSQNYVTLQWHDCHNRWQLWLERVDRGGVSSAVTYGLSGLLRHTRWVRQDRRTCTEMSQRVEHSWNNTQKALEV